MPASLKHRMTHAAKRPARRPPLTPPDPVRVARERFHLAVSETRDLRDMLNGRDYKIAQQQQELALAKKQLDEAALRVEEFRSDALAAEGRTDCMLYELRELRLLLIEVVREHHALDKAKKGASHV